LRAAFEQHRIEVLERIVNAMCSIRPDLAEFGSANGKVDKGYDVGYPSRFCVERLVEVVVVVLQRPVKRGELENNVRRIEVTVNGSECFTA
jgi:hypothetical protein